MDLPNIETTRALETSLPAPKIVPKAEPFSTGAELPEEPLFVIERSTSWMPLDLRETWAYRELLYFLTWRDLKVRYKQTALGATWVIMQPLLSALIFTIFFGRLARVPSEGVPYTLFAYAGLLPWMFFSGAIMSS